MINELFTALEAKTRNESTAQIFKNSGMLNKYRELEYGFFPLGYGILSDDFHAGKTVLSTCKIIVLGNDFGTADYLVFSRAIGPILKLERSVNNTEKFICPKTA